MNESALIIVIAAIPTTIAALGAFIVAIINARKAETIASKVDAVHVLTNSNLSAVTSALQVANEKISGLEKLMASMTEAKKEALQVANEKEK